MPLYNVEAINLRSSNFGEADKLMTLFTRSLGKLRAVAKGARRTTSKFGGRLEIFAYNQYLLASGKNLDIVSQCETIESFRKIRESREKLGTGAYILKIADLVTEERQKNVELFDLLLDTLYALERLNDHERVARAFEVKLCDVEGFLPSAEMLERKYKKLPFIVEQLRGDYTEGGAEINSKDLAISAKIFKELISDHTGVDIRRIRTSI